MAFDILPGDWSSIESDPSTRDSVHLWTKNEPVDVTLAVAGTAEDLWALSTTTPVVNHATNPSMETGAGPTGYTASGATIARSTTVASNGTYSMSITPDNAATGEGAYMTTNAFSRHADRANALILVASVYLQDNVGSGDDARIMIADSDGASLANGNTITLSSSWQRSTAFYALTTTAAAYRIYIVTVTQHGTVFYADDLQVELSLSAHASTYCDGAQGLNYEWEGTAHASRSRRTQGIVAVRGYTLQTTRDLYIAEDHTANASDGASRFVRAGTDFWEDFPLHITGHISILNVNTGEQPRVYGIIRGVHAGGRK